VIVGAFEVHSVQMDDVRPWRVLSVTMEIVYTAFNTGLRRTREHLLNAQLEAQPGGSHVEMSYNFHAGTAMLMAIFDGIAEHSRDQVFENLVTIQKRSLGRESNGMTMATLRQDIVTGFKPWQVRAENCDVSLVSGQGPLLRGLVFPLFNDAVEALAVLYGLVGLEDKEPIHAL